MKKVLLIEDRSIRQHFFTNDLNIDLEKYSDILDNYIDELYIELELQLENNSFNFDKYDYIISHKSAFGKKNNKLLERLKDYCKVNEKALILFSGGISSNYYDTSKYELLELNSKTFYSKNFELFLNSLKNNNENILMLCYGKQWKSNIVANMIEKINLVIERISTILDENKRDKISYKNFVREVAIENLKSIKYDFYTLNSQNILIEKNEIINFRDSLYLYLSKVYIDNLKNLTTTQKNILIHNNNIADLHQFDNHIKFTPDVSEIDEYISKNIIYSEDKKIKTLLNQDFNIIYIKDKLSSNYLDLYGIRVAYHIRLSQELEDKKYVPIIILSDLNAEILNKIEPMANILFTKNIFLIENTKEAIEKSKIMNFSNLTLEQYQNKFLNKIEVKQPKDYLTHHSIANEWSMYRWAEYLDVNTPDIKKIRDDISSMLYFKYLQTKYPIKRNLFGKHKREIECEGKSEEKCKILYIDDEWEKGWKSIFQHLSQESKDYTLETVEKVYKDKSQEEVIAFIEEKIISVDPDVIILDMRLHEDDFLENVGLEDFTGIQIFSKIKDINPGIQVIIFTASSNSLLLDQLNSYDSSILGYVKKEHPKNYNLTTQGNINKLISLVNKGLERRYLKRIWLIQNELIKLNMILEAEKERDDLNTHIKGKAINLYELQENKLSEESEKLLELKSTIPMMYEILDSDIKKKFSYSVLTIFKCLEIIADYYIKEESETVNNRRIYYAIWKYNNQKISQNGNCSVNNKLSNIINQIFSETEDLNQNINKIVCTRNTIIHPDTVKPNCVNNIIVENNLNEQDILNWFEMLCDILENMDIFERSTE